MPKCPKDCKKQNPLIFKKTVIPAIVGNDDITPPENGAFCNMLVVYEATGNAYLYSSDGVPTLLSTTDYARLNNLPTINGEIILGDLTLEDLGISQLVEAEAEDRREADAILQTQIDAITASSDVVDIVGTYEELEEYDTSKLTDNDIIKVISDETVGGATTYYRWENSEWIYIGAEGPYYTKNETNALLNQKLDVDALDNALEDYYDKTETDALLADKADVVDLADKQDKLIAGDNITIDQATNVISTIVPSLDNYYTKQETYSQSEVDGLISDVEGDIPTSTSQLINDSGFLTTLPIATSQLLGGVKVGSGLSITPDGTLSADAQNIDIDDSLSTASTNPVENRVITNALNNKANIADIPTVPVNISAFYNDAGYITGTTLAQNYYNKTETYTKTEVDNFISGVSSNIPTKTSDLTNDGSSGNSSYVEATELGNYVTLTTNQNNITGEKTFVGDKRIKFKGTSTSSKMGFTCFSNTNVETGWMESVGSTAAANKKMRLGIWDTNTSTTDNDLGFQYRKGNSTYYNLYVPPKYNSPSETTHYIPMDFTDGTNTVSAPNTGVVDLSPLLSSRPSYTAGTGIDIANDTISIDNTVALKTDVPTATSDLVNDGSDGTSTYVEADDLATVATSGSYNDLSNRPTIGDAILTIQRNGSAVDTFTANATTNKSINIAVPTATSDLTNDSGFLTSIPTASANTLGGVMVGAGLSITNGVLSTTGGGVADAVEWSNVLNKPTDVSYWTNDAGYITSAALPTKTSDLTNDGSNGTSTYVEADVLAAVATSGSYNDLSNKPTIPTVNDATLTIQRNSVTVDTFTANASQNKSINIVVPTKTSDLTNDSNFATTSQIPTKTSDLTNDGSDGTAQYLETDETAYKTASIPYGVCDGTSTSTVYTATVPGITELRDGICMWLKNGVVTSASGFTININGLGAKPVYSNMAAATRDTTIWNVAYTMFFVYDSTRVEGGCWILYRGYDSNTNTIGYQVRTNSQTMPMSSITYRYRLLFTSADGEHYVPANNSTSTNATSSRTVCQDKIDPFGAIYYYGTTASVAAGSRPAAANLWQQYVLSLGYSFNRTGAALTLTSWKPVYVKAAPQSDGSAIIDSTTPYVQDLPTAEDGMIYIFLGKAYSTTNIELEINHPVYWYKDGMIRPYTNAAAGISSVAWGDITGTLSNQTDLNTALGAKANSADLAPVATSGSYADLTNKPTIPTVNNATLTIQKNGTTVKTFTANASSNVTANITVPTQTSELTNNSGFLTASTLPIVTSISSSSTDSQVPSAKCMYTAIGNVESVLQTLNSGTGV